MPRAGQGQIIPAPAGGNIALGSPVVGKGLVVAPQPEQLEVQAGNENRGGRPGKGVGSGIGVVSGVAGGVNLAVAQAGNGGGVFGHCGRQAGHCGGQGEWP